GNPPISHKPATEMTSLGFRRGHDHIAERAVGPRKVPTLPVDAPPTTTSFASKFAFKLGCPVPRGLIPTLLYSALALAIPLTWYYNWDDVDYDDDMTVGLIIGGAALGGLVVVFANDCCCWYNMMLAFHIGVEYKVLDETFKYSTDDARSDRAMALSMAAAIVIIVHLVPFLVSDRIMMLTFLAYAGVIVNVATLVYVDPDLLFVAFASSLALLANTMIVGGICEIRTSLLSLIGDSVKSRKCLSCQKFEM
ncbi:MAG: hypothetical protein VXX04_07495, partial [Actinomycetota bacterium]|nr:hypothetical protein [Actinomycetota bacterium]